MNASLLPKCQFIILSLKGIQSDHLRLLLYLLALVLCYFYNVYECFHQEVLVHYDPSKKPLRLSKVSFKMLFMRAESEKKDSYK